MKNRTIKIFFAAALIALLCSSAVQARIDPGLKYVQPPETCGGYDFASQVDNSSAAAQVLQGFVTFDDWTCPNGLPITDIHWWGSYWQLGSVPTIYSDSLPNADPIEIDSFVINIYSDIAADDPDNPMGFSMPNMDDLLYSEGFAGNCNETYAFTDVKATDAGGEPTIWEDVYKYDVYLETPFEQEEGRVYWLMIAAVTTGAEAQWGWHSSSVQYGDSAVQAYFSSLNGWSGFWIPCDGPDMSFELTTVPEPGTLMAFGAGMSGILVMFLKRRRPL